ncbi:hypothetical protein [Nocardia sp. NPDC051833]|uniref:hypothetical protein n=1 Tax=Nocardia sp. NPDC051833 TaxID=3155674 RepID=UPI003427F6CB
MTGYEPRAIPDGGENAWHWRHAEIARAFTALEVTDAIAQADRFDRIAVRWTEGLDAFARTMRETLATAWAGVGADAAGAAVSAYVARARELTPALVELPGLVRAAAEAIVATKYAIPELVFDEPRSALSPSSGAAAHRVAAAAEESARLAMRERYVLPFSAIDDRIPVLPTPIRPVGSEADSGRQRARAWSADGTHTLSAGRHHQPLTDHDHALRRGGDEQPSTDNDRALPKSFNPFPSTNCDHPQRMGSNQPPSVDSDHALPTGGDHRPSAGRVNAQSTGDAASGVVNTSAAVRGEPCQVSSPDVGQLEDSTAASGGSIATGLAVADSSARESVGEGMSDGESAASSTVVSSSTTGVSTPSLSAAPGSHEFSAPGSTGFHTPGGPRTAAPSSPGPAVPSGTELHTPSGPRSAAPGNIGLHTPSGQGSAAPGITGLDTPGGHGTAAPSSHGSAGPSSHGSAGPSGHGFHAPGGVGFHAPGAQRFRAIGGSEFAAHSVPALPGIGASVAGLGRAAADLGDIGPGSGGPTAAVGDRGAAGGMPYRSGLEGDFGRPEAGRSVPGAVGPVIGANPPGVPAPARVIDRLFHYAAPFGQAQAPGGGAERAVPAYLITRANTDALLGEGRPTVAGGVIGGAAESGPDAQHGSSARG